MKTDITTMTRAELEQALAAKTKEENKQREAEKKAYISKRDTFVDNTIKAATELAEVLANFNTGTRAGLDQHAKLLAEYGGISKQSKGGFSLETSDGLKKVVYKYASITSFDERAQKAEELLKDFLGDTVKKKDLVLHDIIMSLLERNKAGKLEYSRIVDLYKHEDKYSDERWVKAIQLFKESFSVTGAKMYVMFFTRPDVTAAWEPLELNFNRL